MRPNNQPSQTKPANDNARPRRRPIRRKHLRLIRGRGTAARPELIALDMLIRAPWSSSKLIAFESWKAVPEPVRVAAAELLNAAATYRDPATSVRALIVAQRVFEAAGSTPDQRRAQFRVVR